MADETTAQKITPVPPATGADVTITDPKTEDDSTVELKLNARGRYFGSDAHGNHKVFGPGESVKVPVADKDRLLFSGAFELPKE